MTDTSYDLCPTCGREKAADICPAMCGVDAELERLADDILAACREKAGRAEKFAGMRNPNARNREEHRQEVADLSWTIANLRHIDDPHRRRHTMKEIRYSDRDRSGGRQHEFLFLFRDGQWRLFDGENIPGFAAIVSKQYEKAGKWSGTDFVVRLADGIVPAEVGADLHETLGEGQTWEAMYRRFVPKDSGVPVGLFQTAMRASMPKTSARIDKTEAGIAALNVSVVPDPHADIAAAIAEIEKAQAALNAAAGILSRTSETEVSRSTYLTASDLEERVIYLKLKRRLSKS